MRSPRLWWALLTVAAAVAAPTALAVPDAEQASALACAAEAAPASPPGKLAARIGAIALDGARAWASTKPPVGLAISYKGRRYRFLKAFAYVLAKPPATVTLTIVAPRPGASLYYVPAPSNSPNRIVAAASSSVSLAACPGPTGYVGGVIVERPTCLRLTVRETGMRPATARLPIAPAHCR